ncbi:MAG TPA: phosphoribosylformylglycinamidine synthase subunit PurS [Actinomycetota bacterium]|nr:phosphoribosylformylglycinamidine synthase subunit PurS [Actinomycetota bacterium]
MLKPGMADPQGRAVEDALPTMGWSGITDVRVGKHVELTVEAASEDAARMLVEEIAGRVLSNPVIEDFRILSSEEVG